MTAARRSGRAAVVTVAAAVAGSLALAACGTTASPSQQPGGTTASTTAAGPPASPPTATPSASATSQPPPTGFTVLSMTFVSDTRGFALGTATCSAGRCVTLLGTTDGGEHWQPLTPPASKPGSVYSTCPHGAPCVQQVRFATPAIGYAFDPSLFVTTDGGQHWQQLPGTDVSSLEAAGGTVARVISGDTGCAGQPYHLQTTPAGSPAWQTVAAPTFFMICPPVLYRQGDRMVLAAYGNPAGGVRATAQIDRSADSGRTWTSGQDACGGKDGYASTLALAPPATLALLCQHQIPSPSGGYAPAYLRISASNGATYGPDLPLPNAANGFLRYQLAAASNSTLLVVETGTNGSRLLRTSNGGKTWSTSLTFPARPPVILVGFEDPQTARIAQGNTVWTTTDAGHTWTSAGF